MLILYIIILAIALMIQYFIAKQFESVAADKGYIGSRFFHLSFWLGLPGWLLVIALPDHGGDNNDFSQVTTDSVIKQKEKEIFIWHPIDEATASAVGETNIKCENCHRVQFKGNTVCNQCGAKFIRIDTHE